MVRFSHAHPCRLVLDADNIPMVVPFVHTGMQDIMPIGAKLPRIGQTVRTSTILRFPLSFHYGQYQ